MEIKGTFTFTVPDDAFKPAPVTPAIPAPVVVPPPQPLFSYDFTGKPDGILTNEYAMYNPLDPKAKVSAEWRMTSGTLFVKNGQGYTGIPDEKVPDILSATGNNSQDFRLTTKRNDFKDVSVKFDLNVVKQVSGTKFPATNWDGCHVFLRYQSEESLYYASVNRRDKKVIIKKKVPGGPSNGGTYYPLTAEIPSSWNPAVIQNVEATIKNQTDGSVLITLLTQGKELARAIDDGKVGGPPILTAGATGIRGDNTEFTFNKFTVWAI